MRILIAEDEAKLAAETARFLRETAWLSMLRQTASMRFTLPKTEPYHALVLDLGLPGMDGMSLLSALRKKDVRTPVLILTARDRFADKAAGFRAGPMTT